MGKAIPTQHPAVVLRSHYVQLRALLATAMIAVLGLSAAVVILATDARAPGAGSATRVTAPSPADSSRYDGGPEEGTRGAIAALGPGVRYDGGPEEGTAALTERSAAATPATHDLNSIQSSPGVRYDGGPEEGSRGALSSGAASEVVSETRYDGGPEEGSRGIGH